MRSEAAPSYLGAIEETARELPDGISIRRGVSSRQLTTFGVGGEAECLVEPASLESLKTLLLKFSRERQEFRLLGAGSNLVFPDGRLDLPVLRFGKPLSSAFPVRNSILQYDELLQLDRTEPDSFSASLPRVIAFAGCPLMGLSRKLSLCGLSGMEFAAGIPGTIGGAVRMNAGAHGQSMAQILSRIFYLSPDGRGHAADAGALSFSYRASTLPHDAVIVAAELLLLPDDPAKILEQRQACLEYRRRTQPLQLPSAGSVFRNPQKAGEEIPAAGALLESAGMKGIVRGGVSFSDLHANWLVRTGDQGRSDEAGYLVQAGKNAVMERFGISLEPEIVFW